MASQPLGHSSNQRPLMVALEIRTRLPEHGPAQPVLCDVLGLAVNDHGRIIRNKLTLGRVIRVTRHRFSIIVLHRSGERQSLVIINSLLPSSWSNALKGMTDSVGVLKGTTVDGHANNDLVRGDTLLNVVLDSF